MRPQLHTTLVLCFTLLACGDDGSGGTSTGTASAGGTSTTEGTGAAPASSGSEGTGAAGSGGDGAGGGPSGPASTGAGTGGAPGGSFVFEGVDASAEVYATLGGAGRGGPVHYDWDGDGTVDLLGHGKMPGSNAPDFAQIAWQRGLGGGVFGPRATIVTAEELGIEAPSEIVAFGPIDLEGDGTPDLVATVQLDFDYFQIVSIRNQGGTFVAEERDTASVGWLGVAGVDPWMLEDGSVVDSIALYYRGDGSIDVATYVGGPGGDLEQVSTGSSEGFGHQCYRVSTHEGASTAHISPGSSANGDPPWTMGFDVTSGRFNEAPENDAFGFVSCNGGVVTVFSPTNLPPEGVRLEQWEAEGADCARIAAADFDGDGLDDLLLSGFGNDPYIYVLPALGGFEFGAPIVVGEPEVELLTAYPQIRDVDSDGDPDVAFVPDQPTTGTFILFNLRE